MDIHKPGMWFLQDFSWFQDLLQISLCLKISSHQGKKEVACIVSKPLVSCLWGCGESVNPPKLNIQEVQGSLSSRPKGDPGPLPIFQDCFIKPHPYSLGLVGSCFAVFFMAMLYEGLKVFRETLLRRSAVNVRFHSMQVSKGSEAMLTETHSAGE